LAKLDQDRPSLVKIGQDRPSRVIASKICILQKNFASCIKNLQLAEKNCKMQENSAILEVSSLKNSDEVSLKNFN